MKDLRKIVIVSFLFGMILYGVLAEKGTIELRDRMFDVTEGAVVSEKVLPGYTLEAALPHVCSDDGMAERINGAIDADFAYVYAAARSAKEGRAAVKEAFFGWIDPVIHVSYRKENEGDFKKVIITTEIESDTALKKVRLENTYAYNRKLNQLQTSQDSVIY